MQAVEGLYKLAEEKLRLYQEERYKPTAPVIGAVTAEEEDTWLE